MLAGERPTQGAPAMSVLHGIHQAGCSVTPDLVFLLDTWYATRALRPLQERRHREIRPSVEVLMATVHVCYMGRTLDMGCNVTLSLWALV
jgi:hypothetical protein